MNWGGDIYLNGSETEKIPYNCSLDDKQPGIFINKSLNMIGFLLPRVFCAGGFYFQKLNDEQPIQLKLSGIIFCRTPLTFEDCGHVVLHNCSFRNTPVALNVQIQNITTFRLDMQGFSFFHNNSQCITLFFLENIRNISRHVTLNISDTYFTKNGFYGGSRMRRGGLRMASNERNPTGLENITISCNNVKYIDNFGSFMDLYVPNAATNETYRGVELTSNIKMVKMVYTLYTSDAREPNIKFIGLRCIKNPSVRCIRIYSDAAEVEIHESFFTELFQALFLESSIRASLRIVNSTFKKNNADAGGSFFATSPRGHLKISLTNVFFSDCSAKKYGCTVAIGKPQENKRRKHYNESIPDELHLTLRNVTVEKWHGRRSKCTAIQVLLKSGKVTIEESRFNKKKLTSVAGALYVTTIGGKSNVTISNCSLIDSGVKKRRGIAFAIVASNGNAGDVTITNSLFISSRKKQKAFLISPKYRIKLINITVALFRYGFQALSSPPENSTFPIDIYIDKCTFMNNVYDLLMSLLDPTSVKITIKNTVFTSNETVLQKSYAIRLNVAPLKNIFSSSAIINLDNDTFDSKPSSNFVFFFRGKKSVTIKRSTFRNCTYTYPDVQKWVMGKKSPEFFETGSGAISILTSPDKPWRNGCLQANTTIDTHPLWHYDSHVIFEDTVFEQNVGLIAGGVHISNGFTKFHRCVFQDNFGIQQTGHIYSAYGTGRVDIENCTFLRTKGSMVAVNGSIYNKTTFLYSESGGPLSLKNTSLISLVPERNDYRMLDISGGGYVDVDEKSTMQCSEGSQLLFDNATHIVYMEKNSLSCKVNATVLRYSCRACSPGYYSLQKGTSRGLFINSTVHCLPCPFGASCIETNIAAKPNFWGYPTFGETPSLQFFACPEHYCESPLPDFKAFNRCHGKRKGTLCGRCVEGFTESLFSSECAKTTKCNHYWLWIVTILLTMGLVLYLLIKPPILSFLGHQILWFRSGENQIRDDLGQNDNHKDADSGYIKITFYFYQVAELLMDGSIESRFEKIPFVYFVISAFNFQVATVNNEIGCPFAGLTAVTKEMLLSGTVFLSMADVVIMYCVHLVINLLRRKKKPNFIHYMAVVMEVLLLGYERLAETSLKLMHCVSIGSGKWLFIDGNVPCFQWWQYILLAYIAVFVLPFIVILYWGSSKLYKSSITTGEFLAACVLPLPFLIYWLFNYICKRRARNDVRSNQEVNNDVLQILHGPFRPPNNDNKGTLHWESVLIGRRFILLACHTFITNAMLRVVCMTSACFLMTIHHMLKNPYRDPLANKAETLSLAVLTLIAAINLPKATLILFGMDMSMDGSNGSYLGSLKWIEVAALAFIPALVSFLVTFALFSQLSRLGVFLFKRIRHACQYRTSADWMKDEERPICMDIGNA